MHAQSQFWEFETKSHLELLILPTSGQLKQPMAPVFIHFYYTARAVLAWTKKKPKKTCSHRHEKLKANRASETEKQRKERLRIGREKDRAREIRKKTTRGEEKVLRNRRP